MSKILIDNYIDKNGVHIPERRLVFIYLCKNDMHTLDLGDFINKIGTSLSACEFSKNTICTGPAQLETLPNGKKVCTYNGNIVDILIGMVITSKNLNHINTLLQFGVQGIINFITSEQVSIVGYCDAVQFNPPVKLPHHDETKGVVDIYNVCNIFKYKGICTTLMYYFLSKLDLDNFVVYLGVKVFEDDTTAINRHSIGAVKCYTGLGFLFLGSRDNKSTIEQDLGFEIYPFALDNTLFVNFQKIIQANKEGKPGVKNIDEVIQTNRNHSANVDLLQDLPSGKLPQLGQSKYSGEKDTSNKEIDPCDKYLEICRPFREFIEKINTFVVNKTTHLNSLQQLSLQQTYNETGFDLHKYLGTYHMRNIRFDADKIMKLLHNVQISPIRGMGEHSGSLYYSLSSQNFVSVLFPHSDTPHASHGIMIDEKSGHSCRVLSQDTFTFHTHPANIYKDYTGVLYGPPSIPDLCLFMYSNIVADQKAHLVVAKEGIYIITLNIANFQKLLSQFHYPVSPSDIITYTEHQLMNIKIINSKIDLSSSCHKIVGNAGNYWFITNDIGSINSIPSHNIIKTYTLFETRTIPFSNVTDFAKFWNSFFNYSPISFIDINFIDGDVYQKESINNTLDIPIVFFNYTGNESDYVFDNHNKMSTDIFNSMQNVLPHTHQYYDGMYIISTLYRLLESVLDNDITLFNNLRDKLQKTINKYEQISLETLIDATILKGENSQQYIECLLNIIFRYISNPPYIDSNDFQIFLLRNPFKKMDTPVTNLERHLILKLNTMFPDNIFTNKVDRYLLVQQMIKLGENANNKVQMNLFLNQLDEEFKQSIIIKDSSNTTEIVIDDDDNLEEDFGDGDLDDDLDFVDGDDD